MEDAVLPSDFRYATTGLFYMTWAALGAALVSSAPRTKDTLILTCLGMSAPLAVVGSAVQTGPPLMPRNFVRHYLPLAASAATAASLTFWDASKATASAFLVGSAATYATLIAPAAAGSAGVESIYAYVDTDEDPKALKTRFTAIVIAGIIVSVVTVNIADALLQKKMAKNNFNAAVAFGRQ